MVGNAVDPRPEGTAAIVPLKTPPQLEMNILAEVAALFQVSFIGPREPVERRSELIQRVPIEGILIRLSGRDGLFSSHTQGSRWNRKFLTNLALKSTDD
jgi:hypothetical protein